MGRQTDRSTQEQVLTFVPKREKPFVEHNVRCPRCGKDMLFYSGDKAQIIVCSDYPDCREARIQ